MKLTFKTIALACITAGCGGLAMQAAAQSRVYRCGNEYTNNISRIEQGGCTPLTGGNLTIVRAGAVRTSSVTRHPSTARRIHLTTSDATTPKATVESSTQRTRDEGARGILQMELDGTTWNFKGGFPPNIYARVCDELGLSNNGTRARAVAFESFGNIEERSRRKPA